MSPKTTGDLAERQPTYSFPEKEGSRLLGELILYIAERSKNDLAFGAIKLNKLLWWADFLSYARDGEPITGVEYRKLAKGPAPVLLEAVRNGLVREKAAKIVERKYYSHVQLRVVPLRDADTSLFTTEQLELVDGLIDEHWGQSAAEVSEESHGKAWRVRKINDLIPYESVFLSDAPTTRADIERTHELAERFGWART